MLVIKSRASFSFLSTALAFLTSMSEKCKSTSPGAIQVKQSAKDRGYLKEIRHNTPIEKGE